MPSSHLPEHGTSRSTDAVPLVDTHCHLVFKDFQDDIEAVARRWRHHGVQALVHACVTPDEIPAIRAMADRLPELRYGVGLHPLEAECWQDCHVEQFRVACQADQRVVAIGELGLDLFKASNLNQQVQALEAQLDLAAELDLPVIVHCRDAAPAMRDLLHRRHQAGRSVRGVMHCWGGSPEEMGWFLDMGFYISFSGTVTFKKAEAIHACAQLVPEDRYVVETDCPFLAPVPHRGKRNEPAFVADVAARVAHLRGCEVDQVRERTTANARQLFGLHGII